MTTADIWERLAVVLDLRVANDQLTLADALAMWDHADHLTAADLAALVADLEADTPRMAE
jgi:hypothetical protein